MNIEERIIMLDETAEGSKGNASLTTSILREVLDEVKKEGVREKDFIKHPELRDEIIGADGKPAFKSTSTSHIPEVKPKADPVLSMDGVVAPEKAPWVDDHAQAVAGKKGNVSYISSPLQKTPEEKISIPLPRPPSRFNHTDDPGAQKISNALLKRETLRRSNGGK